MCSLSNWFNEVPMKNQVQVTWVTPRRAHCQMFNSPRSSGKDIGANRWTHSCWSSAAERRHPASDVRLVRVGNKSTNQGFKKTFKTKVPPQMCVEGRWWICPLQAAALQEGESVRVSPWKRCSDACRWSWEADWILFSDLIVKLKVANPGREQLAACLDRDVCGH